MPKSLPYTFRHANGQLYFKRRIPRKSLRANPKLPETYQITLGTTDIEDAIPAWQSAMSAYKSMANVEITDLSQKSVLPIVPKAKATELRIPTRSDIGRAAERWYHDYLAQYDLDNDLKTTREYGHVAGKVIGGLPESVWEDRLLELQEILPNRSAVFAEEVWTQNHWHPDDPTNLFELLVDFLQRAERRAIETILERASSGEIEFESDKQLKKLQRQQSDFTIHDAIDDYKRRFPTKTDMIKKLDAAGSAWRSLMSTDELSRISARDVIEFVDLLRQVPARCDLRFEGMSLRAAIEANSKLSSPFPFLKAKTVKTNYVGPLSTAVSEAMEKQLTSMNPFYGVKVRGSTKQAPHRRSFYVGELRKIFDQPVFTGCRDKAQRNTPGDMVIKDHYYWPAIVALYTGLRASEIGALRIENLLYVKPDTKQKPYLEVKGTKTENAHRWVPIHPDLEQLGFIDFVDRQRRDGLNRIFPEWNPPKGKKLSDARCIRNFNLKVATVVGGTPSPTFHCLRHTLSTELINADFNVMHRRFILGHATSQKDISEVYYTAMMDRIYDSFCQSVVYEGLDLMSILH